MCKIPLHLVPSLCYSTITDFCVIPKQVDHPRDTVPMKQSLLHPPLPTPCPCSWQPPISFLPLRILPGGSNSIGLYCSIWQHLLQHCPGSEGGGQFVFAFPSYHNINKIKEKFIDLPLACWRGVGWLCQKYNIIDHDRLHAYLEGRKLQVSTCHFIHMSQSQNCVVELPSLNGMDNNACSFTRSAKNECLEFTSSWAVIAVNDCCVHCKSPFKHRSFSEHWFLANHTK